jgi:hypothetical protein
LFVLFCWFACSPTGCVCKGYVQSVHWVAFGMLLLAKKEGLSTLPFPLWHVCVCVCVITFRPLALPLSRDVGSGAWNWEVYNGGWFLLGCICGSWYWVFVWRINQTVWKLPNVAWLLIGGLLTSCRRLFSLRYVGECVGHVRCEHMLVWVFVLLLVELLFGCWCCGGGVCNIVLWNCMKCLLWFHNVICGWSIQVFSETFIDVFT